MSVQHLFQEDSSSLFTTKYGARSRAQAQRIHSNVLLVSERHSFCRSPVLILSDCVWSWEGGEGEVVVDHEMCCSPLLASSGRLKSDISCCYFGMACCQAVVASHLGVAEVK